MKKIIAILAVLVLTGMNVWAAGELTEPNSHVVLKLTTDHLPLAVYPLDPTLPATNDVNGGIVLRGESHNFTVNWTVTGDKGEMVFYRFTEKDWEYGGEDNDALHSGIKITSGSQTLNGTSFVSTTTGSLNLGTESTDTPPSNNRGSKGISYTEIATVPVLTAIGDWSKEVTIEVSYSDL